MIRFIIDKLGEKSKFGFGHITEVPILEDHVRSHLGIYDDVNLFGKVKYFSKDAGLSVRIGRTDGKRCYVFYEK